MLCCLCLQDLSIILLLISVRQIHEVIAVLVKKIGFLTDFRCCGHRGRRIDTELSTLTCQTLSNYKLRRCQIHHQQEGKHIVPFTMISTSSKDLHT